MTEEARKGHRNLWIILAAAAVVLAVALYMIYRPPSCSFDSYKRSVNITLGAQVEGTDVLKGALGLSDAQLRSFDSLLNAYGAFYETSCLDQRRGMISKREYNCRMRNLDSALLGIESFQGQLGAIARLTDPTAEREEARAALAKFQSLPQESSLANCGPILSVNPQELDFRGMETYLPLTVSNIGYENLNFSIKNVPSGFIPIFSSHTVAPGRDTNVVLTRTNQPIKRGGHLQFEVVDDQGQKANVTISVDTENARVYSRLASQAKITALHWHRPVPTLGDVELMLSRKNPSAPTTPAVKNLVSAQVLERAGNKTAARIAFHKAVATSETLHAADFVSIVVGKPNAGKKAAKPH